MHPTSGGGGGSGGVLPVFGGAGAGDAFGGLRTVSAAGGARLQAPPPATSALQQAGPAVAGLAAAAGVSDAGGLASTAAKLFGEVPGEPLLSLRRDA